MVKLYAGLDLESIQSLALMENDVLQMKSLGNEKWEKMRDWVMSQAIRVDDWDATTQSFKTGLKAFEKET
jgi:hypothetical protein